MTQKQYDSIAKTLQKHFGKNLGVNNLIDDITTTLSKLDNTMDVMRFTGIYLDGFVPFNNSMNKTKLGV
tara:strand:- start:359 stop:565 length:207 start_codon:yes stop_codon:yes gene_type:complete